MSLWFGLVRATGFRLSSPSRSHRPAAMKTTALCEEMCIEQARRLLVVVVVVAAAAAADTDDRGDGHRYSNRDNVDDARDVSLSRNRNRNEFYPRDTKSDPFALLSSFGAAGCYLGVQCQSRFRSPFRAHTRTDTRI